MKVSLGNVLGVKFSADPAFLGLLALAAATGAMRQTCLILLAILHHEMAHLIAASCMGAKVTEVELMPFGAVSTLETGLDDPMAEGVIAMAGPMNNLIVVGICKLLESVLPLKGEMFLLFLDINAFLGLLNLVPVLPLDGGRLLRSALSRRVGYGIVTQKLSAAGRAAGAAAVAAALLLGVRGVAVPWLGGAGIFLFIAADRERTITSARSVVDWAVKREALARSGALPVRQVLMSGKARLIEVLRQAHPRAYNVILVASEDLSVTAAISEAEVAEAFSRLGMSATLEDVIAASRLASQA